MWVEMWVAMFGDLKCKWLIYMVGAAGFEPTTSTV